MSGPKKYYGEPHSGSPNKYKLSPQKVNLMDMNMVRLPW